MVSSLSPLFQRCDVSNEYNRKKGSKFSVFFKFVRLIFTIRKIFDHIACDCIMYTHACVYKPVESLVLLILYMFRGDHLEIDNISGVQPVED